MSLNLAELAQITTVEDLHKYIHEKFTWETISNQDIKDIRTLSFYEAFLTGADAVFAEFGEGLTLEETALAYLRKLDNLEGCY